MKEFESNKFDLNKGRGMFFLLGLNISLLLVISAFEWQTKFDTEVMKRQPFVDVLEEIIPITEIEEPKPPKPKAVTPVLIEIPNDEEIDTPEIIIDLNDITDDQLDILLNDVTEPKETIETYDAGIVESKPEPMEGYQAFYEFIGKNLKYPSQAKRMQIEGKVFIMFVIDERGDITDLKVIRGIGGGCDEEALRVMKILPAWKPGKQRGRPVKVRMVLPLTFKLN